MPATIPALGGDWHSPVGAVKGLLANPRAAGVGCILSKPAHALSKKGRAGAGKPALVPPKKGRAPPVLPEARHSP